MTRFVALILLASLPLVADDDTGVILGALRNAVTGAPVADAKVSLRAVGAARPTSATAPANRDQNTDVAGTFRFDAVPPGPYELSFQKAGYVDSRYEGGPVEQVRVNAGTEPTRVAVALVPTATIEGRVLDEDGKPLKGVLLYAERDNLPRLLALSETGGAYQLEFLPPATNYRIEVWVPYPLRKETARRDPDSGGMVGYPSTQFYPGVEDARAAALIPVAAGNVQGGFDIRLKRAPLVELTGRAVDASTKEPIVGAEVELRPAGGGPNDSTYDRRALADDGSFRFDLIRPGRYSLLIYRVKSYKDSPFVAPVEVGTSGLHDLEERVPTFTRLAGRVVIPPEKAAEWGRVKVVLGNPASGASLRDVEVGEDGAFAFDDVSPGQWNVSLMPARGVSRPWYVAAIRFGQDTAQRGRLNVLEGANPPVEIVLGADAAQLSGLVRNAAGQPAANGMVLARSTAGAIAYQSLSADGAFTLFGLAPGDYTVTAVPSRDVSAWVSRAASTCGAKSLKVSLGANERRSLSLELCVE